MRVCLWLRGCDRWNYVCFHGTTLAVTKHNTNKGVKLANGWLYQGQRPGLMFELECNRVSPGGRDGRAHLPEVGGAPCHPEGPFSTAGAT